jgi:hypothetical protein
MRNYIEAILGKTAVVLVVETQHDPAVSQELGMMDDPLDFLFDTAYHSPHHTFANQNSNLGIGRKHLTPFREKQSPPAAKPKPQRSSEKLNQRKKRHEKKKNVRIHPIPSRSSPEEIAFQLSGHQSATGSRSYKQFSESIVEKISDREQKESKESTDIGSQSIKRNSLRVALEYSKQQQQEQLSSLAHSEAPSQSVGPVSFSYMTIGFNNNLSNLPEWTCLRDNYIRQLHSLESHESIACQKGFKTEISIPNFVSLLLSLRKISCRIVYAFQVSAKSKTIHDTAFSDLHGYVLRMVNDMSCINRSPFIDWLGILTLYNPFLSCRKLDGTPALVCLERKPSIGVQIHRATETRDDETKVSLTVETLEVRDELRMTESEQEFVDSLSETVWTTFLQHQEATKYRRPGPPVLDPAESEDAGKFTAEMAADLGYQNLVLNSQQLSSHIRLKGEHWRIWRRRYLIRVGLRNIREGRERGILRQVSTFLPSLPPLSHMSR